MSEHTTLSSRTHHEASDSIVVFLISALVTGVSDFSAGFRSVYNEQSAGDVQQHTDNRISGPCSYIGEQSDKSFDIQHDRAHLHRRAADTSVLPGQDLVRRRVRHSPPFDSRSAAHSLHDDRLARKRMYPASDARSTPQRRADWPNRIQRGELIRVSSRGNARRTGYHYYSYTRDGHIVRRQRNQDFVRPRLLREDAIVGRWIENVERPAETQNNEDGGRVQELLD